MNQSLSPLSDFDADSNVGELLYSKLVLSRESGGYGGCVSYKEFSDMCHVTGFTEEETEDCWYDILMGVPVAKVTDMSRFVETFVFYLLSLDKPIEGLFSQWEKEAKKEEAPFCAAELPGPSSVSLATPCREDDSSKGIEKHPTSGKMRILPRTKPTISTCNYCRYAQNTSSSANRLPAQEKNTPATKKAKSTRSNPVFERLYNDAVRQQQEPKTTITEKEEENTDACALPSEKTKKTSPSPRSNSQSTFTRPTQSFYARVAAAEKTFDRLDDAPETPRVAYHAPPGPSSVVPNGYIECVAKLRRSAECSRRTQFKDDLRSSMYKDPSVTLDGPILRLPISTVDRRAVDIKLSQV
ncbi:hypothetical protein STCU_05324 [Strigomonas culicis]|uniref:Uncharacterized protein n=1 Tax=Strigomonas culicis TaxID=28005 RepID=S9UH44_9TRYP|nr:hypothetical protein STCU_05324 [Strigomonas culicis]|eukprot:EPY28054.1 hypothetical protein STCU_05324 [Strigomonas culicis]